MLDYYSLHDLQHVCAFYLTKSGLNLSSCCWIHVWCSSCFPFFCAFDPFCSSFFSFCVFGKFNMFFLLWFCFRVKPEFLVWFMNEPKISDQPSRVYLVGSTQLGLLIKKSGSKNLYPV